MVKLNRLTWIKAAAVRLEVGESREKGVSECGHLLVT